MQRRLLLSLARLVSRALAVAARFHCEKCIVDSKLCEWQAKRDTRPCACVLCGARATRTRALCTRPPFVARADARSTCLGRCVLHTSSLALSNCLLGIVDCGSLARTLHRARRDAHWRLRSGRRRGASETGDACRAHQHSYCTAVSRAAVNGRARHAAASCVARHVGARLARRCRLCDATLSSAARRSTALHVGCSGLCIYAVDTSKQELGTRAREREREREKIVSHPFSNQLRNLITEKGLVHEQDAVRVRTLKFVEVAALCKHARSLLAAVGCCFRVL